MESKETKERTVFTLQTARRWEFALEEEPDKVYSLPALDALSYEEGEKMRELGKIEKLTKQGPEIKAFILRHCPALEEKNLGDMQYYVIFNAWALSEGENKLGESKASRNS